VYYMRLRLDEACSSLPSQNEVLQSVPGGRDQAPVEASSSKVDYFCFTAGHLCFHLFRPCRR